MVLPTLIAWALQAPWGAWMPCCAMPCHAKLHLGSSAASGLDYYRCLGHLHCP